MESIKKIRFLIRECGFLNTLFYIFMRTGDKFNKLGFVKKRKALNKIKEERLYDALKIYTHQTSFENGKRLIQKHVNAESSYDIYLRPYSSDSRVMEQVLYYGEYKCVIEAYNQVFTSPAKLIIDCGSNIGLTSLYFSKFYPDAKFIAIEPFKDNLEILFLNFKKNNLNNYEIIEAGVWDSNKILSLNRNFRDGKEWSVALKDYAAGEEKIQARSLVDIIDNREVDILKIDIEGGEKVLFEDEIYASLFLRNVKCLALEIHDILNIRQHIYNILTKNNFYYFTSYETTVAINRDYLK